MKGENMRISVYLTKGRVNCSANSLKDALQRPYQKFHTLKNKSLYIFEALGNKIRFTKACGIELTVHSHTLAYKEAEKVFNILNTF